MNNQKSKITWAVHPKPKEDELLSSWITRLAISNGLKPNTLWRIVLAEIKTEYKRKIATVGSQTDEYYFEDLINFLSEKTSTPIADIEKTVLTSFPALQRDFYPRRKYNVWILPRILGRKTDTSGLQFCPECLVEDETPYYRRSWRLSFVFLCLKHRRILFDRCPSCDCPIKFLPHEITEQFTSTDQVLLKCHYCRYDFRCAVGIKTKKISDDEFSSQKLFIDILYQEWANLPGFGAVHSLLYFLAIYKIIQILCVEYDYQTSCSEISQYFGIPYKLFHFKSQHKALEILPVEQRRMIMRMTGNLLANFPDNFVNFCKTYYWKVTAFENPEGYTHYVGRLLDMDYIPYWYFETVKRNLTGGYYKEILADDDWCVTRMRVVSSYIESNLGTDYMKLIGLTYRQRTITVQVRHSE